MTIALEEKRSPLLENPRAANELVGSIQKIVDRLGHLEKLDLDKLEAKFPFSVKQQGFFREFLTTFAGGPDSAYRYLLSSASFFTTFKSLMDSLISSDFRVAMFSIVNNTNKSSSGHAMLSLVLETALSNSQEFFKTAGIECPEVELIQIPDFPTVEIPIISKAKKRNELANEFAEWLFLGKEDLEVMKYAPYITKHGKTDKTQQMTDILTQLKIDVEFLDELEDFRIGVKNALAENKKIIFTYFTADTDYDGSDLFLFSLHKAISTKTFNNDQNPGLKILSEASVLLDEDAGKTLKSIGGNRGGLPWKLRNFKFSPIENTPSVVTVLKKFLPEEEEEFQSNFANRLLDYLTLPGIGGDYSATQLKEVLLKRHKQGFTIDDMLEFALEETTSLTSENLTNILNALYQYGVTELSDKVKHLILDKFSHEQRVLDKFDEFATYKPKKVGILPSIFEDVLVFDRYLALELDSYGMNAEAEKMASILTKSNVAVVVDGTNYHPEFVKNIAGEKIENDKENSGEKWGDYTRHGTRLIQNFARKVVEGEIPDFKDWSLVKVKEPNAADKVYAIIYKILSGINTGKGLPDLEQINQLFSEVNIYNNKSVVVIDVESMTNMRQVDGLLRALDELNIKVVVRAKEAIPGFPQVHLTPLTTKQVNQRLKDESARLAKEFLLDKKIDDEVIDLITEQVERYRGPTGDPLNYSLIALQLAAQRAKANRYGEVVLNDVTASLSAVFHLPDPEKTRTIVNAVEEFVEVAPLEILGQKESIERVSMAMMSHILGTRDPSRPLSVLLPGPTGVGKTELVERMSLRVSMPFLGFQGSRFSEPHTVSSLLGSPSGYVGPDEGVLYKFVKENTNGIVFIDEIEKMHPTVYTALMNFFDRGVLTAGNGESVMRPGFIIFAASNAGAEQLNRKMSEKEVRELLSREFKDADGNPRPELIARWEIFPMLAITRDQFEKVISNTMYSLSHRFGFIQANLKLVGVDKNALDLLFEETKKVCASNERDKQKIEGFKFTTSESQKPELYNDMRFVKRAFDRLSQDSITRFVMKEYSSGRPELRQKPREVVLVGDLENRKILLRNIRVNGDHGPGHT